MSMKVQELFGGALTVHLPENAKDISDIRQIPDNQEVFAHPVTDQSIIIEILEYVDKDDEEAIKTHFSDLASDNDVQSGDANIVQIEEIPNTDLKMTQCDNAYYVLGQQNVSKFNEAAKNTVDMHIGLFRISKFTSDILVTFNNPSSINPQSSSHHPVPVSATPWTLDDFRNLLTSLCVVDEGIFGQ
ncbi:ran guanine nucleotide release factor-like [Saccostrea echinata]|uniref:ran guanine nucleotide release factor-like n=1 Tax=Saccostrea echinata TaxID=191078 RepID=UPI002A8098BA|nr:ran guanine nucleotide release factor-like [Saccostrea echinata]